MPDPVRIVIADDHPVVRAGLRAMLGSTDRVEIVGEAASGTEAVSVALETRPAVVIMDLNMPGLSGEGATAELAVAAPEIAVLVLTMDQDDERLLAAFRAGARGYVLKGAEPDQLVGSIEAVSRGELVVGPGAAERLIGYLRVGGTPTSEAFPTLTARERQVLSLMTQGAANPEIARRLGLRPKTVRNHVSNVLVKLRATDRADAILRAKAAGLETPRH